MISLTNKKFLPQDIFTILLSSRKMAHIAQLKIHKLFIYIQVLAFLRYDACEHWYFDFDFALCAIWQSRISLILTNHIVVPYAIEYVPYKFILGESLMNSGLDHLVVHCNVLICLSSRIIWRFLVILASEFRSYFFEGFYKSEIANTSAIWITNIMQCKSVHELRIINWLVKFTEMSWWILTY